MRADRARLLLCVRMKPSDWFGALRAARMRVLLLVSLSILLTGIAAVLPQTSYRDHHLLHTVLRQTTSTSLPSVQAAVPPPLTSPPITIQVSLIVHVPLFALMSLRQERSS